MAGRGANLYARASARNLGRNGAVIKLLRETQVMALATRDALHESDTVKASAAAERTTALLISLQRSLDFRSKDIRRVSETLAMFYEGLKIQIEAAARKNRPDLANFVADELEATLKFAAGLIDKKSA